MRQTGFIELWMMVAIVAIGTSLVGGGYLYIQHKDNVISDLQNENGKLRTVIQTKDDALAKKDEQLEQKAHENQALMESMKTLAKLQGDMQQQMAQARAQADEAVRIFAEHDVPKLMEAKPVWMTKLMQNKTEGVWSALEDAVKP